MVDDILDYLRNMVKNDYPNLYIVAGCPVSTKLDRGICPLDDHKLLPPQTQKLIYSLYDLAGRSRTGYDESLCDSFPFSVSGLARFRVAAYHQRGSLAAVVRKVAFELPDWRTLHIPEQVMGCASAARGLVLITGAPGSGTTTTQACILDSINRSRCCHIMTLEDPIEVLHRNDKSIVSQQEIGTDIKDYASGLQGCLQQDAEVVMLGDLPDYLSVHEAITAAESGRAVFVSKHADDLLSAAEGMINSFPVEQRERICLRLTANLHTIIYQRLLPAANGGHIPAFAVMGITGTIREMLQAMDFKQLRLEIAAGKVNGLATIDQSIVSLYHSGQITLETALNYADNEEQMRRRCG